MDAVLTREPAAAGAYATALEPLGLAVVAMPVTRFDAPADEDRARLVAAALHLSRYDAVLIASPRAAEALVSAMGGDVTALWGTGAPKVWAIGAASAAALARAGVTAAVPPKADAAGLADAVIAGGMARRILLPRAEGGRDEGIAALEAAGATVDAITAYRTVPVAADDPAIAAGLAAVTGGRAGLVALFAPSQVTALDAILGGGLATLACPLVAIGATTAAAITAAGATAAAVAEAPTPEGMAKAAAAVYPGRP